MSDLTTLTGQLSGMKQSMIDRLTAQGKTGYTMSDTMEDIVAAYNTLQTLNYDTTTITENGVYMSDINHTGYNNFIVNVPSGGPATHKKYKIFDRVREDIVGDTIGTVVGFHYDANNIEYAVVCLDAVYRLGSNYYISADTNAGAPVYSSSYTILGAKETATYNCDKVMEWINAGSDRSSIPVEHCRSKTFTIGGITYASQVPTAMELNKIYECRAEVIANDPTAIDNPSLVLLNGEKVWSCISSGYGSNRYYQQGASFFTMMSDRNGAATIPVLEIPNIVVSE